MCEIHLRSTKLSVTIMIYKLQTELYILYNTEIS